MVAMFAAVTLLCERNSVSWRFLFMKVLLVSMQESFWRSSRCYAYNVLDLIYPI